MSARNARPAHDDDVPSGELVRLQAPVGQGEAMARWIALARRGRLPHGFLVTGPRGSGKSTAMAWFAAALLCPSDLDTEAPCGVCRTCSQVANHSHADVHVLELARDQAEKKMWGKERSFYAITVDQVRRAQETLQRHAVLGRARVLCIEDADSLSTEAQNALLKTLEEPGQATFLLLEAVQPDRLLPTVHSRLQRLALLPLPEPMLRTHLQHRIPQHAARFDAAVRVGRGSLGACMLACTEQVVQVHDLVLELLREHDRLRPLAMARAVLAGHRERHEQLDAARTFLWLLRSEVAAARDALAVDAAGTYVGPPAEPWTTWIERTLEAERDLELQINPDQVLVACLVQFVR
ncbi:MAG: AAA family ATPase [Planctomycetes bacterium]|nr:AAA family ATPase [Planctomycetota bacterium]